MLDMLDMQPVWAILTFLGVIVFIAGVFGFITAVAAMIIYPKDQDAEDEEQLEYLRLWRESHNDGAN